MVKVVITTVDPVHIKLYDKEECIDLFGLDYLEEYGISIPEELLNRYKEVSTQFWEIQKELRELEKINVSN